MPDAVFADIKDDETIYSLEVEYDNTYGNSIKPNDYIDLYIKTTENDPISGEKIIFGKFIESIRVLEVRDSANKDIFENGDVQGKTSQLLFAVKNDFFLLLSNAKYLSDITIFPVLREEDYQANVAENETAVSREVLLNLVLSRISEKGDLINKENLLKSEKDKNN